MSKQIPVKDIEGVIKQPTPITNYLGEYIDLLGNGERELIGIKTGEVKLDRALLGLSGVMILGGKAGGGKTTLALHLAKKVAQNKTPVLFYSLEMPKISIVTKLLSSLAKVGYGDILLKGKTAFEKGGKRELGEDSKQALQQGLIKLQEIADYITIKTRDIQDGEVTFDSLLADIEYLKRKHKTEEVLVIVDHLQLFTPSRATRDQIDKEQDLINKFKEININTGASILLISQQNKASYDNAKVTSIKGSVDIIYLADIVMFVKKQEEDTGEFAEVFNEFAKTDIELIIDKNRYNAPATLKCSADMQYSLIEFEE
jgi:replicative DNA helicase